MSRVLAAIARHAIERPEAVALSGGDGSFTYGELLTEVQRAAAWLKSVASPPEAGSPVGVALENKIGRAHV